MQGKSTPLHVAADKGHIVVVQLLLAAGSDANAQDIVSVHHLHWVEIVQH